MFGSNAFGWIYFGGVWIRVYLSGSDAIALSESTPNVSQSQSDSGTLTESYVLSVSVSDTDIGTLSEASSLTASLSDTDTGTLSESESTATPIAESDGSTLTESENLTALLSQSDVGGLSETPSLLAVLANSDAGTLSETQVVTTGGATDKTDSDTGHLSETWAIVITTPTVTLASGAPVAGPREARRRWIEEEKYRNDDDEILELLAMIE